MRFTFPPSGFSDRVGWEGGCLSLSDIPYRLVGPVRLGGAEKADPSAEGKAQGSGCHSFLLTLPWLPCHTSLHSMEFCMRLNHHQPPRSPRYPHAFTLWFAQSLFLALSSTSEKIVVVVGADWGVQKEGRCGQWFGMLVRYAAVLSRFQSGSITTGNEWRWGHPHEE